MLLQRRYRQDQSTRVPSDTTATMLERQVNSKDSASLSLIRKHGSATPGV